LQECLRHVSFPYYLSTVRDGEAALAFLQRQAPYRAAPRPDLILLASHLPKQSGWAVLAWLRTQPFLTRIPVVMLTALGQQIDQLRGWESGADEFLTKPCEPAKLLEIGSKWCPVAKNQPPTEKIQ